MLYHVSELNATLVRENPFCGKFRCAKAKWHFAPRNTVHANLAPTDVDLTRRGGQLQGIRFHKGYAGK